MAVMVPIQHSFNHYVWELEQVADLDRQYWQTVTSVIPTGGERLLFNKNSTIQQIGSHEQKQELRIALVTTELCCRWVLSMTLLLNQQSQSFHQGQSLKSHETKVMLILLHVIECGFTEDTHACV